MDSYWNVNTTFESDFSLQLLKHQLISNESFAFAPLSIILMAHALAARPSQKGKTVKQNGRETLWKSEKAKAAYINFFETEWSECAEDQLALSGEKVFYLPMFNFPPDYDTIFCFPYQPIEWDDNRNGGQMNAFHTRDNFTVFYNQYFRRASEGHIDELVQPHDLDDGTILFSTAGYFKGTWKDKFNPSETFKNTFFSSNVLKKNQDFMTANQVIRNYYENEKFQVLSLPYTSNLISHVYPNVTISMNLILPKARFGLADALKTLNASTLDGLLSNTTETYMKIAIPKWRIDKQFGDCKEILESMGLADAMTDFSTRNSHPVKFRHMASIGMDENGSNTEGIISDIPIKSTFVRAKQPKKFIADHPFLFVLTLEKTQLLVGIYN